MAIEQAVAHRRPRDVANQIDCDTLFFGKAQFMCQDRQRGVDQRHESDAETLGRHGKSPISASLVTIASATSTMRRLDCMA